jgi:hypothetical protein
VNNAKAFVVLVFSILSASCSNNIEVNNSIEINKITEKLYPQKVLLKDVSVLRQPNNVTCGITSTTILSRYYNCKEYSVNEVIERNNVAIDHGTNPSDMIKWLNKEIPIYSINYHKNESNSKIIQEIHKSLVDGNPVAVFFGSPNPYNVPYYDFHISIIYGLDLLKKTISIANAYGYYETISLIDFQKRILYKELEKYPAPLQKIIINNKIALNQILIIK